MISLPLFPMPTLISCTTISTIEFIRIILCFYEPSAIHFNFIKMPLKEKFRYVFYWFQAIPFSLH